jgi:hypothetical protein
VIHRDIKPANIMVKDNTDIKVTDFGSAALLMTERTVVDGIGTPAYMSPEQHMNKPANLQTDIYALGVVMFQMLTGRLPFTADNIAGLAHQVLNADPPLPSEFRTDVPTELDLVVSGGVHAWLTRNAGAFGFVQRMSWEPWHWGFLPGCGGGQPGATAAVASAGGLQPWVPAQYRQLVLRSARAAGITPALLAAVLKAESDFNPRVVSSAGAQGIAQFMPGTARGMGVDDPFDPAQAIPGSARLIASGIREFRSVPLALAAYNAGGGAVRRYRGIPPYPETQAYVDKVMALAGQGGALSGGAGSVVLVRAGELLA